MNEWFYIGLKAFWCGFAALGFGVLFNAPPRTLFAIWAGGFLAGFVKFALLQTGFGVIFCSFIAAVHSRDCQYTCGSFPSCATYDLRDTICNTVSARCICVPDDAGINEAYRGHRQ